MWPQRLVTPVGRARRLRELLPLVDDDDLVGRAVRELTDVVGGLSVAIDGESTTRLPAPCPHCGRRSLVVFHEQGVIRCTRKVEQICVCSAPDCPCRDGKRHEWWRNRGRGRWGEWDMLARLLARSA